ncbi:hypothetical protein GCM10028827_24170 [Mucilaginibacter myungsuensis]
MVLAIGLTSINVSAQSKKQPAAKPAAKVSAQAPVAALKTYVIKGNVKNFTETFWSYFSSGLFKNLVIDVPVKADGSFFKTMETGNTSDIHFYLGEGLSALAKPGDTLTVEWDNKDIDDTFKITSNSGERQQELDLLLQLSKQYRKPMMDAVTALRSKDIADVEKFNKISELFTGEVKLLVKGPVTGNSKKILYDIYFRNLDMISKLNKTSKTNYVLPLAAAIPDNLKGMFGTANFYQTESWGYIDKVLDETMFMASHEYRDFLVSKVQGERPFSTVTYEGPAHENTESNFTLLNCYGAIAKLNLSPLILDWYLAHTIIDGFGYYPFDHVEAAYKRMLPEMKTAAFKDELTAYYKAMHTLKPGNPAPIISLKDENGKTVSLSDFKGKVVFMDFWGVYCGPCIGDIKTYGVEFHQKYKDKGVVFLNICVDAGVNEWKKSIADLKFDGINLRAPSPADPACKAYNVEGIPHYIIIDAKGNIVNNNAPNMGSLMGKGFSIKLDKQGNNELDLAITANK